VVNIKQEVKGVREGSEGKRGSETTLNLGRSWAGGRTRGEVVNTASDGTVSGKALKSQ